MVQVSQAWLNKYDETLVPETFIGITLQLTEPGLQETASVAADAETSFSDAESIVDIDTEYTYSRYATGELNFTLLDSTFEILPDSISEYGEAGYVSEQCVSDDNYPIITFSFSRVHTKAIPGIVIVWSNTFGEFAKSFTVTSYNGTTVVDTYSFTDNSNVNCEVDCRLNNYDSISIQVLEWCLPQHRARIEQVQLGKNVIFNKGDLMSYTHTSSRDPISGQLPEDSVKFSIDNSSQRWDTINPDGLYEYLYERQPVTVRYGMDVDGTKEWISGGQFFLSEWSAPANGIEASFTARDAFAYLMVSNYTGRKYGTLYEMAYDALELLSDNVATYEISEDLKNYSTDITDDNTSYKDSDILQMVANAAGMALYQTRDGVITIKRIPALSAASENIACDISDSNNFSYPEITYSSPIKDISCSISVTNDGKKETKTCYYPENSTEDGATQTVSNKMLNEKILAQSDNILTEAYAVLSNRKKVSLSYRASPHLDALDFVKIHHKFDYESTVLTTKFTFQYTGCFHGTVEGYMLGGE